jgi:hypothetical protein
VQVTRAWFIRSCTAAAGIAFVDPGALLRAPLRVDTLTASTFRPHILESFIVNANGSTVELTLREVTQRPVSRGVEQFSLVFRGPAQSAIDSGTHPVWHPVLGAFDLSLLAIGLPDTHRSYQASFSRMTTSHTPPLRT